MLSMARGAVLEKRPGSRRRPGPGRHASQPTLALCQYRDKITQLYIWDRKTLAKVQEQMFLEHGIYANKSVYNRLFKKWGLSKNSPRNHDEGEPARDTVPTAAHPGDVQSGNTPFGTAALDQPPSAVNQVVQLDFSMPIAADVPVALYESLRSPEPLSNAPIGQSHLGNTTNNGGQPNASSAAQGSANELTGSSVPNGTVDYSNFPEDSGSFDFGDVDSSGEDATHNLQNSNASSTSLNPTNEFPAFPVSPNLTDLLNSQVNPDLFDYGQFAPSSEGAPHDLESPQASLADQDHQSEFGDLTNYIDPALMDDLVDFQNGQASSVNDPPYLFNVPGWFMANENTGFFGPN